MSSTVFIAHTREDRKRFVEPLSVALERVDFNPVSQPWMLAGRDSLIDAIFREGLKDASALIVVLSGFNVAHEWTRHELDGSVIDRIKAVTRLVVIALDDRQPPAGIGADVPVFSVQNPGDLIELSTLLQTLGPMLADNPDAGQDSHTSGVELHIPGLGDTEATLFALACRSAIENNSLVVKAENVNRLAQPLELDEASFRLALEALVVGNHVNAKRANGGEISVMEIDRESFGHYMNHLLEDFDEIVSDLAAEIVSGARDNESLVERSQLPALVVTYVLDELDARGQITVIRQMKGNRRIKRISPEFHQMYGD